MFCKYWSVELLLMSKGILHDKKIVIALSILTLEVATAADIDLYQRVVEFLRKPDHHGTYYLFTPAHERAEKILKALGNSEEAFEAYEDAFKFLRKPDRHGTYYLFDPAHERAEMIVKATDNPKRAVKDYIKACEYLRKPDRHGTYYLFDPAHDKALDICCSNSEQTKKEKPRKFKWIPKCLRFKG